MQRENSFEWSDAWILTGMMCYVKSEQEILNKVSLVDIIAVADWINHAILMHKELNEGLFRLMRVGYVTNTDKQFSLTELVLPLYFKFAKSKRGILEKVNQMEKLLTKSYASNKPEFDSVPEVVSEEDFTQAIEEYRKMQKGR